MKDDRTFLLVEDDDIDVKIIVRAFREIGISSPLVVKRNGEEALTYLEEKCNSTSSNRSALPDLILLDLNMPLMNGIEFLETMKANEQLKRIPVIVLTTSKDENDRTASFALGIAGYIIKPTSFEDFVEAMKIVDTYWTLSELP